MYQNDSCSAYYIIHIYTLDIYAVWVWGLGEQKLVILSRKMLKIFVCFGNCSAVIVAEGAGSGGGCGGAAAAAADDGGGDEDVAVHC